MPMAGRAGIERVPIAKPPAHCKGRAPVRQEGRTGVVMRLVSLWLSGPIRNLDRVCMASWLRLGHEVDLYSFGPVEGLPAGARLLDAREVLSPDWMDKINPQRRPELKDRQRIMNYSDLFRIALMQQGRGLWLDTDVMLFQRLEVDENRPYFAWEDRTRIGSPVFYVPRGNPMLADYQRVYESPDLMPHWLGFRRRVLKPLVWRLRGQDWSPADLGLTIYGNDAFTRLAKKHGLARHALPTRSFYAWNGKETGRFFDPAHADDFAGDARVLGLHVHWKQDPNRRPRPGSMFDRAWQEVRALVPDIPWQD